MQEYCGDVINFKTYSVSYKNKKRHKSDSENLMIFKDVHEAIVDRELFEEVQFKRGKLRKRPMANGENNMFRVCLYAPIAAVICIITVITAE